MKTKRYTKKEQLIINEIGEEAIKFFINPKVYREKVYTNLQEANSYEETTQALNEYFVANYIRAYDIVTDKFNMYVSILIKSMYKKLREYANKMSI